MFFARKKIAVFGLILALVMVPCLLQLEQMLLRLRPVLFLMMWLQLLQLQEILLGVFLSMEHPKYF